MSIFEAIVLGIIQGITEFLPISSTAHLTITGQWLKLISTEHPQHWTAFIAVIQLGTMLAVLAYFFKDLWHITIGFFVDGAAYLKSPSNGLGKAKLGWLIIVGTIPVVIFGLTFKNIIEGNLTKSIPVIATSLIVLALILWLAENIGKRTRTLNDANWIDALVIGFAQSLALIPGSSRSGTTITAGLLMGMNREDAARFSFLLSVPAVLASGLLEMYEMRGFIGEVGVISVVAATIASGIVGYLAIDFLLKYLRTHNTYIFIVYRIVLGIGLIILWI